MKRFLRTGVMTLALIFFIPFSVRAEQFLIPVGTVIGLQLRDDSVTVAAYDDTCTSARDAGIRIGDQLVRINGISVNSIEDVRTALENGDLRAQLTIRRNGKTATIECSPDFSGGQPRLGLYLRQGIAGIGTVTYYDPETGLFGTLGHGVNNGSGNLLALKEGTVHEARVDSVVKGRSGHPGQLKGSAAAESELGRILKNTPQGVFCQAAGQWQGQLLPTAAFSEIHTGSASIRCTVSGTQVQEYSVDILKIYPQDRSDGRTFLLKVTDPQLLSATGGIVQGMSGSPICQDGKIVGAVTHVLVNDPTLGYGIFIENMLDAAG